MNFDRFAIRRNFSRAASGYATHARLQAEVGSRLLDRLDGLNFSPSTIVDLGAGPGLQARELAGRFPKARVVAMDVAVPMLHEARAQAGRWRRRFERVAGDAEALPLADGSVDLLYSNLMLQWCDDVAGVLNAFRRVLRPGGLLLVSTFGPDTLRELREAFRDADDRPHTSRFVDVQALGDALVRAGFSEPVLDTDWLTSRYARPRDLLSELKAIGATHAGADRPRGLSSPRRLQRMLAAYEDLRGDDGRVPATWEVVSASAWAPDEGAPIRGPQGEEASVSVASIGRRRRNGT
ncbi:MAG: malonyl-ACP O-methyltransferase BioC [Wenzhouxiangellaceae bacterium]|nr:malonyl-ACP O-methyltransferase BioC [Wenzhouxiangellaceae bacterium]